MIHIYTAPAQPATCFTFHLAPRATLYTDCCRVRRQARFVLVRVYYDWFEKECAPGHGCKKGHK